MDAATLAQANATARRNYSTPGHFAALTSRLTSESEDATWLIVGDSTGNSTYEWVYLTAQWLADRFPRWTVVYRLWDHASQTYSTSTMQTGTGSRTLTVLNCSVPGETSSYPLTRIAALTPVKPQLVTVNYGHNDLGSPVLGQRINFFGLTRILQDYFPSAGLTMIVQNPRAVGEAKYAAHMVRLQAAMDLCGTEGYGMVNVLQAYLENPDYATDWLEVDGFHPNAAGMQVWARAVQQQFAQSLLTKPATARPGATRVWVPASQFGAIEGAPTLAAVGATGFQAPLWSFDKDAQQGVAALVDWPDSWQAANFYAAWTTAGTGYVGTANQAMWSIGTARFAAAIGGGAPFPSTTSNVGLGLPDAFNESVVVGTAFNSGAWSTTITRCISGRTTATPRPTWVCVKRHAAHASDFLAETAYLRGVYIERAA